MISVRVIVCSAGPLDCIVAVEGTMTYLLGHTDREYIYVNGVAYDPQAREPWALLQRLLVGARAEFARRRIAAALGEEVNTLHQVERLERAAEILT